MDTRAADNNSANNLREPVFTLSYLKEIFITYRHQSRYIYQATTWVLPYIRPAEEIELEQIISAFERNRQQDGNDQLTADEQIRLAAFSYKNPAHPLCSQVGRLFHEINGTGRHYDVLKLYLDKNLLTADSLSFLFTSDSALRLSIYNFISAWNLNEPTLTHTIVEYAASIMLAVTEIANQQILLLFKALHQENNLTLETVTGITNNYREKFGILISSLEIIMKYDAKHPDSKSDINFEFLDQRLRSGQFTPDSLQLLADNNLLTKNILLNPTTPTLLQRLTETQLELEKTRLRLQKNNEPPAPVVFMPPPPPPPLPTFKMPAPVVLPKSSASKNSGAAKKALPFQAELEEALKNRANRSVKKPENEKQNSDVKKPTIDSADCSPLESASFFNLMKARSMTLSGNHDEKKTEEEKLGW